MKNKLLFITRQTIPYIKELRPLAGSVTACILWQQLDFYFVKYPNGFYKFLEPCNHKDYKRTDSWVEELGFSKKEFRSAFDKIGIRYLSKTQYDHAKHKFQRADGTETFFCSYYDKFRGLTFYFRNHRYADQALDDLIKNSDTTPHSQIIEKQTDALWASPEVPKGHLRRYPKGISIYITESKQEISREDPPLNPPKGDTGTNTHKKSVNLFDRTETQTEKKEQDNDAIAKMAIDYLNERTGRHFKHAQTHFKHINARLHEGFTIDELRLIVDIKTEQWRDDPKMSQYLRPATLFGPKADGYLQAALQAINNPLAAKANGNQVGILKEGIQYNEGNSKDYQPRKSKADEFKNTLDRLYPSTAKPGRIIDVDG